MKSKFEAIIDPGFLYNQIIQENEISNLLDIEVMNLESNDFYLQNNVSTIKLIYIDDFGQSFDLKKKEYERFFSHKVKFVSLVDYYENFHQRAAIFNIGGKLLYPFYIETLTENQLYSRFLRIVDLTIALVFSFAAVFVVIISGFLIVFDSGLPVFFVQDRVGKNGKIFKIYKLRTMLNGSDSQHTIANDPRIFPLGMFLRRLKFDELPQLVNIIFGHMSFFGPRPERYDLHTQICDKLIFFDKRLIVRPGLSGWAQIKNPTATPTDSFQKLQFDIYFIKNISLKMLLKIIFKTIIIFFKRNSN